MEGLTGETAIAVRLLRAPQPLPPPGSFRPHCAVCREAFPSPGPRAFYHQLCGRCGDLNLTKRLQTADLAGCRCLVTGGRVRIGYQVS